MDAPRRRTALGGVRPAETRPWRKAAPPRSADRTIRHGGRPGSPPRRCLAECSRRGTTERCRARPRGRSARRPGACWRCSRRTGRASSGGQPTPPGWTPDRRNAAPRSCSRRRVPSASKAAPAPELRATVLAPTRPAANGTRWPRSASLLSPPVRRIVRATLRCPLPGPTRRSAWDRSGWR